MGRAQAEVVGVALLLAVAVVGMGTFAATTGVVLDAGAADADLARATDAFAALDPPSVRGTRTVELTAAGGRLHVASRDLRVLEGDATVAHRRVDALVFERDGRRVTLLDGAVVADGSFARDPPVTAAGERTLLVGAVVVARGPAYSPGGGRARLRATVTHERRRLGTGEFAVAVETRTPGPWRRHFREQGAVVDRRDVDGDGLPSVVARFENRTAYLFTHRAEVRVDA
ncbi:MAG: hypothetical protein ABEJ04_01640 [Halobacteriaceae archaeon]